MEWQTFIYRYIHRRVNTETFNVNYWRKPICMVIQANKFCARYVYQFNRKQYRWVPRNESINIPILFVSVYSFKFYLRKWNWKWGAYLPYSIQWRDQTVLLFELGLQRSRKVYCRKFHTDGLKLIVIYWSYFTMCNNSEYRKFHKLRLETLCDCLGFFP